MKSSHDSSQETLTIDSFPYPEIFNKLREKEFNLLDQNGHVYLDYTGGNVYPRSLLSNHEDLLQNHILGNPHSTNPTSVMSSTLVKQAREKVISFFNAEDYYCIFTQNATGALKIVGECYPFCKDSFLVLLADNHNSVNGIREYCANKDGQFEYCPIQYEDLRIDEEAMDTLLNSHQSVGRRLFAFPAQSNVSGVKHDLGWIETAQNRGWDVLLDAAAFVPASPLDLRQSKPDFVTISFYKMFGYPTGIGCLLVRKSKFELLIKPWFAGGTVTLASVKTRHHYLADNHERFENGTIDYLGIPSIKMGLDFLDSIGMDKINIRIKTIINFLYAELHKIKHDNGQPIVHIFGPENREHVGGTLIMNFFDVNGQPYPFELIEEKTNARKISIRSGCFCNPGTDEINNCLTIEELSKYFTSRDSGNYYDMMHVLGKMRGAIRVSVGIATNMADLQTFMAFVKELRNRER